MVSGLMFKSLLHFELIFVSGINRVSTLFLYLGLSNFSNTSFFEEIIFPTLLHCLVKNRLTKINGFMPGV